MERWKKLAKRLTKVIPKDTLDLLGSLVDKVLPKENVPDINYPNRSITIEHGAKDLVVQLAKYRAVLDIDEMLSMSSIGQLQWWIHSQLSKNHKALSQEDAAIISALMIQKLQEKEYIKDVTPPV